MNPKKATIALTVLMTAMAFAPLANANPFHVARTFPDNGPAVYVEWKDPVGGGQGGVGWYDPFEPTNMCLVSRFGQSLGGGVGIYYESLRIYQNVNKHVFELGQDLMIPLPCPFAVYRPPDQNAVGTTNFNVDVMTKIGLSVELCLHNPWANCQLDDWERSPDWDLFACKADANSGIAAVPGLVTEKPLPVSFTRGDLVMELTGLVAIWGATAVGSEAMFCDANGNGVPNELDDFGHWHDASARLDGYSRTSCSIIDCPAIDEIVHVGHGSAYVLSDYEATGVDRTGFEKGGNQFAICVHDYFLVLDRASPDQWLLDAVNHLGGNAMEGIDLLRGLFDLSSNNGCVEDVDCPLEGEPKGDPLPPKPEKDSECSNGDMKKHNPDPKDT